MYSTGSGVGEEAVADAADGGEVLGVGGVVLDVAAEADDEVVDGAGVGVGVDAPDLLEDVGRGMIWPSRSVKKRSRSASMTVRLVMRLGAMSSRAAKSMVRLLKK